MFLVPMAPGAAPLLGLVADMGLVPGAPPGCLWSGRALQSGSGGVGLPEAGGGCEEPGKNDDS